MARIYVSQDGLVNAPPVDVYRFIADYTNHHLNFLPPAFSDYAVERGGIGSGTEISFRLNLGGRSRRMRARVDEPDPGRVLVESDLDSEALTTYTVSPAGSVSRVLIETTWQSRGVQGIFERMLAPRLLRGLYVDELTRLDRYAREHVAVA